MKGWFIHQSKNSLMEDTSQWGIALLIGIPIAVFLAWFNKSGSDFKDGFAKKTKKNKK